MTTGALPDFSAVTGPHPTRGQRPMASRDNHIPRHILEKAKADILRGDYRTADMVAAWVKGTDSKPGDDAKDRK